MEFKKTVTYLIKIIGSVAVCYISLFVYNEFEAYKLPYGKKANKIRISANIPTIKSLMYSTNVNEELQGNRWVSIRNEPEEGEVIHVWKLVIPKEDKITLFEERDAFRKIEGDGKIYQLNLNSIVDNNAILKQDAILFEVPRSYGNEKKLSGIELKNLISKWKILGI